MSIQDYAPEQKAEALRADLGPDFMSLFGNDDVTELGVNPGSDIVWLDTRSQDKIASDVSLPDAVVQNFLQRAAGFEDQTLTNDDPDLECSLPDPIWGGSRLSASLPPAVPGPGFSLRKFEDELIPLESYVEDSIMSSRQFDRLIDAIKHHENIAVVGGTASGKTTLLMSILNRMGRLFSSERFVTIEDTPEITLDTAWNWFPFYTFEGTDDYTGSVKDRVHRSLRQSPDRLIVGECRGPGIVALFEALLSGHPGGAFTYHATSIDQFFQRVLMNCKRENNTDAYRYMIGAAVDLVIILEKACGVRYVKQMASVERFSDDTEEYVYDRVWRDPEHQPQYYIPEEVHQTRQRAVVA